MRALAELLERKRHANEDDGFEPTFMPDFLFDFQKHACERSVQKGRSAIFADCGLGKTPMELVVAENVARHTDKPYLLLSPLAVGSQIVREAERFGFDAAQSRDGKIRSRIVVTNYEKLHLFDPQDFGGVGCDESSILKSFDGSTQRAVTQFLRKVRYRNLATATAAPNDYIELGTSSEALGHMGAMDLLNRFFKNDQNNSATRRQYGEAPKWRFKGHAETPFWDYVGSWATAFRKPSDLGFDDGRFLLPELIENPLFVDDQTAAEGVLFTMPATRLPEQRAEAKRTLVKRCEVAASLVADTGEPAVLWCHTNPEAAMLRALLPEAVEVSGADSDDRKEAKFAAFQSGGARILITKPQIGAWGLNWQHCAHTVYFPSHSFEQKYQAVRRFWRFGQTRPVRVDIPFTEGQRAILANLQRKQDQAERMFAAMVRAMNDGPTLRVLRATTDFPLPSWI